MNQACANLPALKAFRLPDAAVVLAMLAVWLAVHPTHAQTVFVPANAVWRYLDDGSPQTNFWRGPEYDDGGWASGPAELGYGDAAEGRPEATMVSYGSDPDFKHITTYFRHTFQLTNASSVTSLTPPRLPVVVRGPYLQSGTPSSVIVKWRTDRPASSIVLYGADPDDLHLVMGDLNETTEHQVQVRGLSPATKYFYAVGTLEDTLAAGADHFFMTQPPAGPARPTRIWAIGDCGTAAVGQPGSRLVRDSYYQFAGTNTTDVWLMLGDNAYNSGTDDEYRRAVFEVYHQMLRNTVLWSTLGNHETYGPDLEGRIAYHSIFSLPGSGEAGGVASGTENYYSFDHANVHFVCLDSEISDRSRSGPMLAWLEADLTANTNEWVIAFWHSPPYTKGSHDSDNRFDSGGRMDQMRTNVAPVLEAYGVDLVLCGHSHNYERSYLLNGHYGYSATLTASMIRDGGSGRTNETGAYLKTGLGAANEGAVYVVAGSAGWATGLQHQRHPAMYITLLELGSMVIDIDGSRLDARFLRATGAIDDYFTIIKGSAPEPFRFATFRMANGSVIGSWKSVAGANYRIERAPSLESPEWTPVEAMPVIATGATTFWTNALPEGAASFYRVVKVGED